jgi:SAM-dependent methyltransferase
MLACVRIRHRARGGWPSMNPPPTTKGKPPLPGAYSDPAWKDADETGRPYEQHRFHSTPKARARHQRDERLLRDYLATLPAGQRILDAPSGQGRFTEIIRQCGHNVVAVELNFGRIRDTHQRVADSMGVQGDALHLPCADRVFDAAVCFRLLHHLGPDAVRQVLRELRRVSRRALVTFYNRNTWNYYRQRLEGKTPRRNFYPKALLEQWCREAGWTTAQSHPGFGFFQALHVLWLS